ncbi:hypothetical protein [Nonomuraea sp. NPDC049028]|uniref:hypothetical protein n=1 Tax=Nonomuraea sp. NPDC049028 TaxID=3364348 RepID=UPI0037190A6D
MDRQQGGNRPFAGHTEGTTGRALAQYDGIGQRHGHPDRLAAVPGRVDSQVDLGERKPVRDQLLGVQGATRQLILLVMISDRSRVVVVDGRLVTGQNPASATLLAERIVELLG